MEKMKYKQCTEEELSSILETKEEMINSINAALASPTLSPEIKNYIESNFKKNPNPNNKEYTKFVLGLLNSKYDDFKLLLSIVLNFTSEDLLKILMNKKLIRNNFAKNELEELAAKIQFGLDCYDNEEKYFNNFVKSVINFIKNVFNQKLFPFIMQKTEVDNQFLDNFSLDNYHKNEDNLKLMDFFRKIYYYTCKALNKELDKTLIKDNP